MTTMDTITEQISHFIGLFHLSVEEARLREAYPDFQYLLPQAHLNTEPHVPSTFEAPYDFEEFDPSVSYSAPYDTNHYWHPAGIHPLAPSRLPGLDYHWAHLKFYDFSMHFGRIHIGQPTVWSIEPPGSVVTYAVQAASISDNDVFSVGGSHAAFDAVPVSNMRLLEAAQDAFELSPISRPDMPGSSVEIIDVIKAFQAEIEAVSTPGADSDAHPAGFIKAAPVIEGSFVNGEAVTELPILKDYLSFADRMEVNAAARQAIADDSESSGKSDTVASAGDDSSSPDAAKDDAANPYVENSVTVDVGSNTAVNEAVVKNLWTGATVTAVGGDHVEVNVIVQTTIVQDFDSISSTIASWTGNEVPNHVFDIATFQRIDPTDDDGGSQAFHGGFPSAWAVAQITGDLLITSWIQQYVFMSDNDVGVLSSSGSTTSVIAGGNTSVNHISINELAMNYDLIIVGGSLYDANIIHQTNILFDNDVVDAASNFATTGAATVSTSGNLLWNQALIVNVGAADRFEAMPDAYRDTLGNFADGDKHVTSGVLSDSAFSGLSGLRVLYITGDLLNLQYISQTTIMGDSDQIKLAMNAVDPDPGASFSVATGSNALVNTAAILDLDSFGKTYVGGGQYSQELLFQAELVSHKPDIYGQDPHALTNEAVLFLDDTMLDEGARTAGVSTHAAHDIHYNDDALSHVLG